MQPPLISHGDIKLILYDSVVMQKKARETVVPASRPPDVPRVSLADLPSRAALENCQPIPTQHVSDRPVELSGQEVAFTQSQSQSDAGASGVGAISEDATDLLNSMFDDDNIVDDGYGLGLADMGASNVFSSERGGDCMDDDAEDGLYACTSKANLKSSLSSALLGGLADDDDADGNEATDETTRVWDRSLLSPSTNPSQPTFDGESSHAPSAPPVQQKSAADERAERLNAQRELERKQREEIVPVSNIDKNRKFLLFGDDDDDDF